MGNQQATLNWAIQSVPLNRAGLLGIIWALFRMVRIQESPQRPYAAHPTPSNGRVKRWSRPQHKSRWPVKAGVVG